MKYTIEELLEFVKEVRELANTEGDAADYIHASETVEFIKRIRDKKNCKNGCEYTLTSYGVYICDKCGHGEA
jgi:hypothetical protein